MTLISGVGVGGGKSTQIFVRNNIIESFANGIGLSGDNGEITNNIIRNTTNTGIFGGNRLYPAPSRNLIADNYIDGKGAGDGITLHDGIYSSAYGRGNIIRHNTIVDVTRENAIDIQSPYQDTIIENNFVSNTGQYPIGTDGPDTALGTPGTKGTIIRNNTVQNSHHSAFYICGDDSLAENNTIINISSNAMAAGFVICGTNTIVRNNTMTIPSDNNRSPIVFFRRAGRGVPSGSITGNSISNSSNPRLFSFLIDTGATATEEAELLSGWTIDNNTYKVASTTAKNFLGGRTWDVWRILEPIAGKKFDQHSTYSGL
jgi:hypothetical protein